jgi:hypothetical protein
MTSSEKIIPESSGDKRPTTDAGQFIRAVEALKIAGADLETASFLFNNFDSSLNFLHHLAKLRTRDIDEIVLFDLIVNVYI